MANMSYCRFENTYRDLSDCASAMERGEKLSASEREYRDQLIALCQTIAGDAEGIIEQEADNDEEAE